MSPTSARPHLHLFGWYSAATGFTRVLEALVPRLAAHYRISWMGIGYKGEPRQLDEHVRLLPVNRDGGDLVGAYAARLGWGEHAPDAVLALNDIWYLEHYSRELGSLLGDVPMVGYLPLDGDIPDIQLVRGLRGFKRLCTYTAHAATELRRALRACAIDTPVSVVGHGVDLGAFAPAPGTVESDFDPRRRMLLAQQLFALPEPSWVVLNASRPDPRKRIDISIEGFAQFARTQPPSVRLCLHQAISHPQFVEPLRQQADALGIGERVIWWPPASAPLDDRGLCALYNACSVGLNTSVGEGFGLVSFEHAATGAPQVLPDHPALRELWGDAAFRLGPVERIQTEYSPLTMGKVTPTQVANALARLHADPRLYRRYARAGVARCKQPDLRWDAVAEQLLETMHGARLSARADARGPDPDRAAPDCNQLKTIS